MNRYLHRWWISLWASVLCVFSPSASWADGAIYPRVESDRHLREWLLLGPIPALAGDLERSLAATRDTGYAQDLLESAGGESTMRPEEGQSTKARGGEYSWQLYVSPRDTVDLADALGTNEYAVAYAAAEIESAVEQTLLVGLGSDDAVRVWLNGELVHEQFTGRPLRVDDDLVSCQIATGHESAVDQSRQRGRRLGLCVAVLVTGGIIEPVI